MAFDVIVFSQKELDSALSAGNKSICLCDGVFLLPDTKDVTYTSIGNVKILSIIIYNIICDLVCDVVRHLLQI